METIKFCKMIINYVLRMIERADFMEMKYTLQAAQTVIDKIPYYQADDVIRALFEGGEENAE